MKTSWFTQKWFGRGWAPASWEGWTATGIFLAVAVLVAGTFDGQTALLEAVGMLAVPFLLFVAVSFMMGGTE